MQKRRELIYAAIDLFAEKGIKNVTVEEIAGRLEATKGKFYHYFKSKSDIVTAILELYESYISDVVPKREEWESEDADAEQILFRLFFQFPVDDMLRFRKIVYIVMSGMHEEEQLAQHAVNYFVLERERLLADCFTALAKNGKIVPLDSKSAARFFNRYLMVCGMLDSIRYPYVDDTEKAEELQCNVVRDCTNFINLLVGKVNFQL